MTHYRECSGIVGTVGRETLPIDDVGDILPRLRSDSGALDVQLSRNLLSLQLFTNSHHSYFGTNNGTELQFNSARTLKTSKIGRAMCCVGFVSPQLMT